MGNFGCFDVCRIFGRRLYVVFMWEVLWNGSYGGFFGFYDIEIFVILYGFVYCEEWVEGFVNLVFSGGLDVMNLWGLLLLCWRLKWLILWYWYFNGDWCVVGFGGYGKWVWKFFERFDGMVDELDEWSYGVVLVCCGCILLIKVGWFVKCVVYVFDIWGEIWLWSSLCFFSWNGFCVFSWEYICGVVVWYYFWFYCGFGVDCGI